MTPTSKKNLFLCILPFFVFCSYKLICSELFYVRSQEEFFQEKVPLEIVKELFSEPLQFLGLGSQCLAFTSPKSPYVCKICKANRYQLPFFLEKLPLSFIQSLAEKKLQKKQQDFLNYNTAYEQLQEETGIIFLHLQKTKNLHTTIRLVDPLHITHSFQADNLLFYIQKKAIPLEVYSKQVSQEDLLFFLKMLFNQVHKNRLKGLWIKDLNKKNIGFCEGKPLWIDPGRLMFDPSPQSKEIIKKNLTTLIEEFSPSLESN